MPERRNNYFDKQAKENRSGHCAYHRTIPEDAKGITALNSIIHTRSVLYFNTFKFYHKKQKGTKMNGDKTRYCIKSRLAILGITQTQLLDEMAKRGFRVSHSNFSTSLRAKGISEVQERYLEEADKILREMESQ